MLHAPGGPPSVLSRTDPSWSLVAYARFLAVLAEYDDVVHPRSSLGLVDSVSSRDRRNLTFPTGHVGAMMSGAALKKLWPQIGAWLGERSN